MTDLNVQEKIFNSPAVSDDRISKERQFDRRCVADDRLFESTIVFDGICFGVFKLLNPLLDRLAKAGRGK